MALKTGGKMATAVVAFAGLGVLTASSLLAIACGGSDGSDTSTGGDAAMTSTASDAGAPTTTDTTDSATPTPTPSIFTFVCSGSATDYCGDAGACFPTYAQAKKASSYCGTKAEYITEYPTLCDGYQMVTVRVPVVGDIDYYYDPTNGNLIAVVNLEEQTACIGAGSPPYGEVRLDPCTVKTNAVTLSIADACNGGGDSGGGPTDTDSGSDDDAGSDAASDAGDASDGSAH
jgi:hypothetical protein